jgi:membrane-bound lytic murein transglycosylase D
MLKRWLIQSAIVGAGATVAFGTLRRDSIVVQAPLVQQLTAGDSAARAKMSSLILASSSVKPSASANKLDSDIEHPSIDKWVKRLSTSMADGFEVSLARMEKYGDMITAKLDAKAMPRDLVYLPLIESNFNPNARSRVHAVGMWQFMKSTAKQYGLAVGRKVDERKNPTRSTDAALDYLSRLHDRLGSWYLAAAAYNSGPTTVKRALKKVTGKTKGTDADFFRIMSRLPRETRDYVPKLIAAARVGNNPARYGLKTEAN